MGEAMGEVIFHLKTQNNENLMRTSIENNENTEN